MHFIHFFSEAEREKPHRRKSFSFCVELLFQASVAARSSPLQALTMSFELDLRATNIASRSLSNDVYNLKRAVSSAPPAEEEKKVWKFAGHQGRKVLVDLRKPCPPPEDNVQYTASSWKIGQRSTEIHPISGQHKYDTGNLYRTVHWKDEGFGLNGYFTNDLARAGMWRHDGLNTTKTRSKAVPDPSHWGTPKESLSGM